MDSNDNHFIRCFDASKSGRLHAKPLFRGVRDFPELKGVIAVRESTSCSFVSQTWRPRQLAFIAIAVRKQERSVFEQKHEFNEHVFLLDVPGAMKSRNENSESGGTGAHRVGMGGE